jgi:hypothetical protein
VRAAAVPALVTTTAASTADATAVITDPRGYAVTYTLDLRGRLTQLATPDGASGSLTQTWVRDFAERKGDRHRMARELS